MILGAARENKFNPKNGVWSIDVVVDEGTQDKLNKAGLGWKIKDGENDKFITLKRNEFRQDTIVNDPVEVLDSRGKPWPQDKLIGNDSEVNVRFNIWEGLKKQQNTTLTGVQIVKHVKYDKNEAFPVVVDHDTVADEFNDEIVQ